MRGLTVGLAWALVTVLTFVLVGGANTWTRYHVSVVIIAARQQGSLQFGAFLDWTQQAGSYVYPVSPTSSGIASSKIGLHPLMIHMQQQGNQPVPWASSRPVRAT
jgi:hypothetical protein